MGLVADAIGRGWANFLARPSGPLNIRFLLQPTVAGVMAVRAGVADATSGRPVFLWTALTVPGQRWPSVQSGWKDVRNVFLIAAALDAVYQVMVQQFIYPLELLFTSALLAVVPYCVLRGPVSRIARKGMGHAPGAGSAEALAERYSADKNQSREETTMSDERKREDWTKPAAMAIPKGGFEAATAQQGRYGPIFPKTPANYGFSILAKIIPGREEVFYEYAKRIEKTIAEQPDALAVLKLHYLRWILFPIKGETYFMYQGIFDTYFDKYTEDAVSLFGATGIRTVFENLEGFPMDWQTNPAAFVTFVREHQCPSFLEYAEYPYVSADEVKKALRLKAAFSTMLDQMQ